MKVFLKILTAIVLGFIGVFVISIILTPKSNNDAKQESSQNITVVFLGDSLTYGVGDTAGKHGYTGRVMKLLKKTYPQYKFSSYDFGKPGDRSDQILKRINQSSEQQQLLKKADLVIMTVGGNDLRQELLKNVDTKSASSLTSSVKKSSAKYETSLKNLLKRVAVLRKSKSSLFIFGNYNPTFVNMASRKDINQDVKLYNAINKKLVKQQTNGYYISIFRQLTYGQYQTSKQIKKLTSEDLIANGKVGNKTQKSVLSGSIKIKNDYISQADHFHPNNLGYDYMAKELFKAVNSNNIWQKK
ncbi:putative exported lipase/acylhydrolase (lipoprotein) [Oenococcus oeni]|uniref:SGNH/GDSL hydrolase family protein n=1 Tax=Oenococcus oeni TaxID=1247 RepID=UPI00050F9160|nr:SGNH/GDSL hydrolase family protein [Oenococcus oeni]AVI94196.1 lysophospholipase [Oenococcus oeni]KGH71646.1 lysophospholipase [Oenococcus oeni IOEB_0502]KGH91003.1 lysophospholipase [Oenococcus oeni IOEB_L26_1]SYW00166.1 putative exported lipase/acylhydrolase (lipoprotein) [Oenococcus oeni]SYW02693.1 putative exported lipase/acylhydrolase (lipoprotein) [Oenococcus oeni]